VTRNSSTAIGQTDLLPSLWKSEAAEIPSVVLYGLPGRGALDEINRRKLKRGKQLLVFELVESDSG